MMSTCRWCTPVSLSTTELLHKYSAGALCAEEERAVNDDLGYCLDCVVEYHRTRDQLPPLHKPLWQLEVSRLLARFSQAFEEEEEIEEDDLFIVEDDQEIKVPKGTSTAEFENILRVPLMEILKYPYLMAEIKISEMCVEAICRMEKSSPFQVVEKFQGIYLLLVHPNETVRRWAIRSAKSLGRVDRDDFYDLQDIFCSMFGVLDLDLFQNPDIYSSLIPGSSKILLLPPHLYDPSNHKDYWLGICMLLTQLDAQAMDSLLLGPDKQNEIIQCILKTMETTVEDKGMDPFWPSLQCFMVILDRLGSKIWGQLIEPAPAFQTITGSPSYTAEIESIRRNTVVSKVKVEMDADEMVTCSQIIYNCNVKEKGINVKRSPFPENTNIFEEMQSLVHILQLNMGQDMRVHESIFLWFIPFVKSVMDLNDLSIVYIGEIIHYLCGEIQDLITGRIKTCDKVTEFFTFILVYIIELHLSKRRMNVLYYSSPKWLEVIIKCASLPSVAFSHSVDNASNWVSSTSSSKLMPKNALVHQTCMQIIRSLLKEGSKLCPQSQSVKFLDMVNLQIREAPQREWRLSISDESELQKCLKELVKKMKDKHSATVQELRNAESTPPQNLNNRSPRTAEDLIKSEPDWEFGQCNPIIEQKSEKFVKVEPLDVKLLGHEKMMIETKPHNTLAGKISDQEKLQAVKSKLNLSLTWKLQDIVKKLPHNVEDRVEPVRPSVSASDTNKKELTSYTFENDEYDDDMPLSVVKGNLKKICKLKKKSGKRGKPMTACSSLGEAIKTTDNACHLQASSRVIVISDSESAEEDGECTLSTCKKIDVGLKAEPIITSEPLVQKSPNYVYGNSVSDYDSQLFEFETQEEMFSEWTDSLLTKQPAVQLNDKILAMSKAQSNTSFEDPSSKGYDTDPVSDENIEKALHEAEEQLRKEKELHQSKRMVASPVSKNCVKKMILEGKSGSREKRQKKISSTNAVDSATSSCSIPAIVPPKKDRTPVEPASTAEKLGLKKKERIAFDLSQRSLDFVGKLRKYGQDVTQVESHKHIKKKRNAMLTSPKKLNPRGNRKLLASQDLQYFRQSSNKTRRLTGVKASDKNNPNKELQPMSTSGCRRNVFHSPDVNQEEDNFLLQDPTPSHSLPTSTDGQNRERHLHPVKTNASEITSESNPICSNAVNCSLYKESNDLIKQASTDVFDDVITSTANYSPQECDVDELDPTHHTQIEPLDMDLCSQMNDEDDFLMLTQRDPVDMEVDPESPPCTENPFWSGETVDKQVPSIPQTESTSKPSTSYQQNDQVFLRPGMSPVSLKKAKPSTTKIYAPSSRSATLVQEMQKTVGPQAGTTKSKIVCSSLQPRKTVVNHSEFKRPLPVKPPCSLRYYSKHSIAPSHQIPTYKTYARPETPVVQVVTSAEVGHKFDQTLLIRIILMWTYEMFSNYTLFGIPSDLCPQPLRDVPDSFSTFEEYFNTFYPLLLINAFEELVSDWLKNTESGKVITHHLKVVGVELGSVELLPHMGHSQIASISFTVSIRDHEVCHQLYLKEDDLVILWLSENKSDYLYDEAQVAEPQPFFGCVSRSNVFTGSEGTVLNLTIKTQGNVSSANKQLVKCELVGSLINTLRQFRALHQLKRNMMVRPLLAPHIAYFQPAQNCVPIRKLTDYNSEQLKAIMCAVSIVNRPEKTPKICLIHGPPGTGKSRTIVGMMQSLFSEGVKPMDRTGVQHAKGRKLRVLLCAPSNAAIDSLMKKIITVFKQNCKDLKNPLGNCGDINLVRLGVEKTISPSVKGFSLDSQTKVKTAKAQQGQEPDVLRRKEQLDLSIDNLSQKICSVNKNSGQFQQLTEQKFLLLKEREHLGRQLKESRSRKQEIQARVLQDAHIICCTLSTSGSQVLECAFRRLGHEPFGCVIVDEAGQATETETLIPLLYRCPALVLVGDPEQLPPIVVSQTAKEKKLNQSLMARLWKCLRRIARERPDLVCPVLPLIRQYRMHPDICDFPSKYIYNNKLLTDGDTAQRRGSVEWPLQPYRLFDVTDGQEVKERDSFCNPKEVQLVQILIKRIVKNLNGRVGVITPYNAQKHRIHEALRKILREENRNLQVEVDTVDGFQGREMDCVIVSCVRASSAMGTIGFLGNRQRLNVTITRAKSSLFILGHLRTLREQKDWGALIHDASKRGVIIKTCERDFHSDAQQIFKQDTVLMRSLSFPPKVLSFPSLPGVHQEADSRAHCVNPRATRTLSDPRMAPRQAPRPAMCRSYSYESQRQTHRDPRTSARERVTTSHYSDNHQTTQHGKRPSDWHDTSCHPIKNPRH